MDADRAFHQRNRLESDVRRRDPGGFLGRSFAPLSGQGEGTVHHQADYRITGPDLGFYDRWGARTRGRILVVRQRSNYIGGAGGGAVRRGQLPRHGLPAFAHRTRYALAGGLGRHGDNRSGAVLIRSIGDLAARCFRRRQDVEIGRAAFAFHASGRGGDDDGGGPLAGAVWRGGSAGHLGGGAGPGVEEIGKPADQRRGEFIRRNILGQLLRSDRQALRDRIRAIREQVVTLPFALQSGSVQPADLADLRTARPVPGSVAHLPWRDHYHLRALLHHQQRDLRVNDAQPVRFRRRGHPALRGYAIHVRDGVAGRQSRFPPVARGRHAGGVRPVDDLRAETFRRQDTFSDTGNCRRGTFPIQCAGAVDECLISEGRQFRRDVEQPALVRRQRGDVLRGIHSIPDRSNVFREPRPF